MRKEGWLVLMCWFWMMLVLTTTLGCSQAPDKADLRKYNGTPPSRTNIQEVKEVRCVKAYVVHDGKVIELDRDDMVQLEYIMVDDIPLDPLTLTVTVGTAPRLPTPKK